jgi:hypothetical protein
VPAPLPTVPAQPVNFGDQLVCFNQLLTHWKESFLLGSRVVGLGLHFLHIRVPVAAQILNNSLING